MGLSAGIKSMWAVKGGSLQPVTLATIYKDDPLYTYLQYH